MNKSAITVAGFPCPKTIQLKICAMAFTINATISIRTLLPRFYPKRKKDEKLRAKNSVSYESAVTTTTKQAHEILAFIYESSVFVVLI